MNLSVLLLKQWHPDRNPGVAGEAKRRFQQIQEAYSVLNDENKRSMYDAGLYDPHVDDDDQMISMMNNVKDEVQVQCWKASFFFFRFKFPVQPL
ncbi:hypothetical protein AALP_AA4G000800 [Arabis alpina]|uniref:J domain-containing protein n=1 Tax=Arabis alpina TaxID=50452 RepID=A0A087H061_ARAAL|nr:hypothetical protein AALP_AA4G000800 [Arabis alpina]